MSTMPNFSAFFEALWDYEPFPWQTMLAERIANGHWPQALDLPTAAGKTACIDAAIYALACQADTPVAERTAPRRIWFVVDRRIVVDEAFERAEAIAGKLSTATGGPLKIVADRLRRVGYTKCPLAVARLRGGILRDDGWARLPSQPAVITSTVDQLGSRIMFRGYGRSHLAAPIFAGLAAHDSLVVLDEAHCSIPFFQTLRRIETYRGEAWAELPLRTPFAFMILSATPPQDIPENARFPGVERAAALDHPKLHNRLSASKVAELVVAKPGRVKDEDPLVIRAAERASSFIKQGDRRRVAVIVNRVRTAEEIARNLGEQVGEIADVVLLTGRIRPFERDRLVQKWKPSLKASSPEEPEKSILFVSTQCIEVGADFSFDALVTECASLDALRQRFGRLNRMGELGTAPAVILIREKNAKDSVDDPIYGAALSNTWALLNDKARTSEENKGQKTIDFGFEALDAKLDDIEDLSNYLAPKPDAPVLLPAHLDLLCQTAPTPQPDPDVQLYLHGKDRGSPEVRVLWRSDLSERRVESWVETVALCPPVSGEMLSVPLYRFRNWLAKSDLADDVADVEGAASDAPVVVAERVRPFLIWRGRDRSKISRDARDVRSNDVIALPASYGATGLGQATREQGFGESALDLWELAYKTAGRPPALRIHRATLEQWLACEALNNLVTIAEDYTGEPETLRQAIDAVINSEPLADDAAAKLPSWLIELLQDTSDGRFEDHPDGGVIVLNRRTRHSREISEPDLFADDDDLTSALTPAGRSGVSLAEHSASVKYVVKRLATVCLPDGFADWLQLAAYFHDVGKLDERFQILLRHGDEIAVAAGEPLAKSADIPRSPARRRAIREASRLPLNFRHEMLSLELARRHAPLPEDEGAAAVILHLIASHHGHARPFAPISPDPEPPPVTGRLGEIGLEISAEERSASIPAHHLHSGLSERFWQLTRRYGWWGLAYLEAILRLGDWYGSEFVLSEDAEL
jgi:CRISPR-associated endonuclease/helicase Cas3